MTKSEKVRKGIDICLKRSSCNEDCPYYPDGSYSYRMGVDCMGPLRNDALELLKRDAQWISVKDRLPEEDLGACIVYDGFKVQHADHYIIDGEHSWNTPDCYESEEIRDVTHWMPLPEPPKQEEVKDV